MNLDGFHHAIANKGFGPAVFYTPRGLIEDKPRVPVTGRPVAGAPAWCRFLARGIEPESVCPKLASQIEDHFKFGQQRHSVTLVGFDGQKTSFTAASPAIHQHSRMLDVLSRIDGPVFFDRKALAI
jgi:hypothetical protein